jgi:hypothetical protein
VQPLAEGRKPISSSRIRSAIARGKLLEAMAMLGQPFTVALSGVPIFPSSKASGSSYSYDIIGQGRILPPPGRYKVLFLDKKHDRNTGVEGEIQIENGCIIVSGKETAPAEYAGYSYIEFLPMEKKW